MVCFVVSTAEVLAVSKSLALTDSPLCRPTCNHMPLLYAAALDRSFTSSPFEYFASPEECQDMSQQAMVPKYLNLYVQRTTFPFCQVPITLCVV